MALVQSLAHANNVWCSSFSEDGKFLATCAADDTLRLWDTTTGVQTALLTIPMIRGCDLSPDSALLSLCCRKMNVIVLRTEDLQPVRTLQDGHSDGVVYCKFSRSGKILASCGWDHRACIWDVHSGRLLRVFDGHSSSVVGCSYSPDDDYMATCSWDRTVRVWDLRTPGESIVLIGHTGAVYDISCCPIERSLLASCGSDRVVVLWDIRTGGPLHVLNCEAEVNCVDFSPTDAQLATGGDNPQVFLWDLQAILKCSSVPEPTTLHSHAGGVSKCTYSSDSRFLASCSSDHTCKIWDLSRPSETSVAQLAQSLATGLSLQENTSTGLS